VWTAVEPRIGTTNAAVYGAMRRVGSAAYAPSDAAALLFTAIYQAQQGVQF
jgi:hypothetical protein